MAIKVWRQNLSSDWLQTPHSFEQQVPQEGCRHGVALWGRSSCGSDRWPSISGLHLGSQVNCSINVNYFYYCSKFPIKYNILKMVLKEMGLLTNGKLMWMGFLPKSQKGFLKSTNAKTRKKKNERSLGKVHMTRVGKDFCAILFLFLFL